MLAVYTGNSLAGLSLIDCRPYYSQPLTFLADAGVTYYFQVGDFYGDGGGPLQFRLEVTPPPHAGFSTYHSDPSIFDTIQFCDSSYDPGNIGFQSFEWDFGDGANSSGYCTNHRYATDGDYTVLHTVTTIDGRTGSASQLLQVRTHDVSITKLSAPKSVNVGQKKTITVSLKNTRYSENVTIQLYRSVDGSNFEWVASLTKPVPVRKGNRITSFDFNYTFSAQDAATGKVIFKAVVIIDGARDAFPIDNEAIAIPPTLIKKVVSYP
jgi:PKD repeat protein